MLLCIQLIGAHIVNRSPERLGLAVKVFAAGTVGALALALAACSAENSSYPSSSVDDAACVKIVVAGPLSSTLANARTGLNTKLRQNTGDPEARAQYDPLKISWRISAMLKKGDPKGSQGNEQLLAGEAFRLCLDENGEISSVKVVNNIS